MTINAQALSLEEAARRIVSQSLGISALDTVAIITDKAHSEIARELEKKILAVKARVTVYVLEHNLTRPAREIPASLFFELKQAHMSIFLCSRHVDEYAFRRKILDTVLTLGLRHAHCVHVFEKGIREGLVAAPQVISALNQKMKARMSKAKSIRVLSDAGSDLEVKISPREHYLLLSGVIVPGAWENLPSGEIVVVPTRVDGIFACDSIPPGNFPEHRAELQSNPLLMEFSRGRLQSITGGPRGLASQVESLVRRQHNTDRIGKIVVGTNYAVRGPAGDEILLDMVKPGVTIGFGMALGLKSPIVRWTTKEDHPCTSLQTTLELDGERVIDNGVYKQEILESVGASETSE